MCVNTRVHLTTCYVFQYTGLDFSASLPVAGLLSSCCRYVYMCIHHSLVLVQSCIQTPPYGKGSYLHTRLVIQWNLSKAPTIGTTTACPEYGGIRSLGASSIPLVDMIIQGSSMLQHIPVTDMEAQRRELVQGKCFMSLHFQSCTMARKASTMSDCATKMPGL